MFGRKRSEGTNLPVQRGASEDQLEELVSLTKEMSDLAQLVQRNAEIALLAIQQKSKGEIL